MIIVLEVVLGGRSGSPDRPRQSRSATAARSGSASRSVARRSTSPPGQRVRREHPPSAARSLATAVVPPRGRSSAWRSVTLLAGPLTAVAVPDLRPLRRRRSARPAPRRSALAALRRARWPVGGRASSRHQRDGSVGRPACGSAAHPGLLRNACALGLSAVGCLRAAELAAPATAVTPSFAGRRPPRPGQSPSDRTSRRHSHLSCDVMARIGPYRQVPLPHRPQSPGSCRSAWRPGPACSRQPP